MSDIRVAICDFCRLAEPIPAAEYDIWQTYHEHTEESE